jgi:hypothetical protein
VKVVKARMTMILKAKKVKMTRMALKVKMVKKKKARRRRMTNK